MRHHVADPHLAAVERLIAALEAARERSRLPAAPTCRDAINHLLVHVRLGQDG